MHVILVYTGLFFKYIQLNARSSFLAWDDYIDLIYLVTLFRLVIPNLLTLRSLSA